MERDKEKKMDTEDWEMLIAGLARGSPRRSGRSQKRRAIRKEQKMVELQTWKWWQVRKHLKANWLRAKQGRKAKADRRDLAFVNYRPVTGREE